MGSSAIIMGLVLFTLVAGLAVGFYQLYSVERAKEKGSTSAFSNRNARTSRTDGT